MESQSPETPQPDDTPQEFRSPLFRAAPAPVGRPPSSTSTSEQPSPSDSPSSSPLPAESSTSAAPSSSTEPPGVESAAAPAQSPAGKSPSEPEAPHSLRETVAHTLTTATQIAHNTLTDDIGRAHHLFLATEGEVESVADGAASILGRRLGPALGSSETGDIVQIVMAVASYATRTFQTWKAARAQRAAVHAAGQTQTPAAV